MKEQLEKRLKELEAEHQKGMQRVKELEAELGNTKNVVIRISGAIQVLQEELGKMEEPSE